MPRLVRSLSQNEVRRRGTRASAPARLSAPLGLDRRRLGLRTMSTSSDGSLRVVTAHITSSRLGVPWDDICKRNFRSI